MQEVADQIRDLFARRFQQEVTAVEEMNLGVRCVLAERAGAVGAEDRVALTPHRKHRHLAGAQVFVQGGIHRCVGRVVAEQRQLDLVVALPCHHGGVMRPGVGADQCLVGDPGQVLPLDRLGVERSANGGFGVRGLIALVIPHRLPEAFDEAFVVAVAVLRDDGGDGLRVPQCESPTDRGAVVLDVDRVAGQAELIEEALGQVRQRVEGIGELRRRRRGRQSEPEVIGCDDVVAVGQPGDQVAEHERAGGEAVQQHNRRSIGVTGFPIEDPLAVNGGVAMVNPTRHDN